MKKIIYILSIIALSFTFNSCESETSILEVADGIGFTGSNEDIEEFLSTDVYQAMLEAGLDINPGSEPNNIEGSYFINPLCFLESDGNLDCDYFPFQITCTNQNNTDLTINYIGKQFDENGILLFEEIGVGKITGDLNGNFTVIIRGANNGFETASSFSGKINSLGIQNYQQIFIFDINQIPLIGEVFIDGDGLSERL